MLIQNSFRVCALGLAVLLLAVAPVTAQPDGSVVAWGNNVYGQTDIPTGLSGVTAIAAGRFHTVALKDNGTVVAWGLNSQGQLNIPAGLSDVTAIAAGRYQTIALKDDGTIVAWGSTSLSPPGLSGVTAIAAGRSHTVALKDDGTVVAWGGNDYGQATVPAGLSGVVAIAADWQHTVALKADGTVVAWGDDTFGQATVPAGLSGVRAIAAGSAHTVALKADGTVVAWGGTYAGQTSVPSDLSDVVGIAAGSGFTVALKSDGSVVAWGADNEGQATPPSGLPSVAAIAAGFEHTVVILGSATVPPLADAGPDQTVVVGQTVALDGSASTGSGPLTFAWTLSGATLADADTATPSFCAAAPGTYTAVLTVDDGTAVGGPDDAVVTALSAADALDALRTDLTALFSDGTLTRFQARDLIRALTRARAILVRNQTDQVLTALGFVADEVTALRDQGVLTETQATALLAQSDGLTDALMAPCTIPGPTVGRRVLVTSSEGLLQAPQPNPMRDRATVTFTLADAGEVRLVVYDALGRAVAVLADGPAEAGTHRVTLDGTALPTGVYLLRLTTADGQAATQRLTLIR